MKVTTQLSKSSAAGEPEQQIKILQGAWSQLGIRANKLEEKIWNIQHEAEK
jgi:hypothetical protein